MEALKKIQSKHINLMFLFAIALIVGCKTGPDYKRPNVAVPSQWSTNRAGGETDKPVDVAEWWKTLNDPMLNDLVARAVDANLDLRISESRVREARAARGIAASALWPTLNASAWWTRSQSLKPDDPKRTPPIPTFGISRAPGGLTTGSVTWRGQNFTTTNSVTGGGGTGLQGSRSTSFTPTLPQDKPDRTTDLFQAGFDASWELDIFGGNRRALEAADADIEAAEEHRRDILVSLVSEVAVNYIELRTAQTRIDITNKNIAAQANSANITRDRFKVGLTSELDAARADALLASTQSQLPLLQTQLAASIHRLGVLLGKVPGALKEELSPLAKMPTAPGEVPVGLPSDLLRRRPDIRQSERELAAATARIGEAMADLFPKFYLTGGLSGQDASLSQILSGANQLWSFGPSVRWPIFQGGRIRANINVQDARQEQAETAYEQTILLALEDVENGLVSFAQEQQRRSTLETAVKAETNAVQLANERYIHGLEGFLNVLEAQLHLFESEDALVQSQSFVLTDLVSLYKALGGGWEVRDPVKETVAISSPSP